MQANEIKVGEIYAVQVARAVIPVRVNFVQETNGVTWWSVFKLSNERRMTIYDAARFLHPWKDKTK